MYRNIWFFKNIANEISDGVIVTNLDFKIVYINKSMEEISGYLNQEVVDLLPDIFNAEPNSKNIQDSIYATVKNGENYESTLRNKRKDGTLFFARMKIGPFYDDADRIVGYIGVIRDVTYDSSIKDDLAISQKRYFAIFDNAPVYINLVNSDGILVDSNSRSEEILGYKREELIGEHFSKFIHPDYLSQAESTMSEFKTSGISGQIVQEYKMIRKDGSIIIAEARTSFLPDMAGCFLHTICFVTDVTNAKHSEEILQEAARELKKSNEELERFAYIASHDLQEPLRVVSSYCQLLKEKCIRCYNSDQDIKKYFNYIVDSTARMKVLIRDLLEYSRVGKNDQPFENVDFNVLFSEVLEDYALRIKDENVSVIWDSELPIVTVIKFRMKQVLHNLLSNSLKFKFPGRDPVVHIGCMEGKDDWIFYVKDNGIGVDKKYYHRIFGLFKRLYTKDEYPGTGIGLAICQRIVDNHYGRIWVES
jgi:PAS domain S-box-containing protein